MTAAMAWKKTAKLNLEPTKSRAAFPRGQDFVGEVYHGHSGIVRPVLKNRSLAILRQVCYVEILFMFVFLCVAFCSVNSSVGVMRWRISADDFQWSAACVNDIMPRSRRDKNAGVFADRAAEVQAVFGFPHDSFAASALN